MSWNSNVYRKVSEEITDRRYKAIDDAKARRQHSEELIPELAQINKSLGDISFMIFGAGISGTGGLSEKIAHLQHTTNELMNRKCELLASKGLPKDYDSEKWTCPICKDTGHIGMDMCSCKREMLAIASIEASGLGESMRTQTFENFSPEYYEKDKRDTIIGYRNKLQKWAENFDGTGNYILTGTTGLGKSHLSSAVALTVIRKGFNVIYITADEFFGAFQRQRFGDGQTGDGTTERFTDCDLLIIDDLGTEVTNKFTISCLYNVINSRINSNRATLISTNLTGHELQNRYEERTASRLFGNYTPLVFSGKDIRRQKLAH